MTPAPAWRVTSPYANLPKVCAITPSQFGPLAKTVLNTWGIHETLHFGDIVYNFIDYNVFSKTDSDRREDFADVYLFDEAFERPFRPVARRLPLPSFAETD